MWKVMRKHPANKAKASIGVALVLVVLAGCGENPPATHALKWHLVTIRSRMGVATQIHQLKNSAAVDDALDRLHLSKSTRIDVRHSLVIEAVAGAPSNCQPPSVKHVYRQGSKISIKLSFGSGNCFSDSVSQTLLLTIDGDRLPKRGTVSIGEGDGPPPRGGVTHYVRPPA